MIVIFDLDGTVWDSEPGIVATLAHTFEALGMEVPSPEVMASNVGPPLRVMLSGFGVADDALEQAFTTYVSRYASHGVYEATLYPGIVELLDALAADGHRLATATSKSVDPTMTMLEHFGILDRFEYVGAASMDGVTSTKDAVLAMTLEALGAPDATECVLIGDRHYDVAGSAVHGIDCIGAEWGYGNAEELHTAGAVAVAGTAADVLALLRRR